MNAPGNGAPHAMTEINFGLHSAESVRLVRHGRPGQGSTYLRTAIIRYAPGAVGLMEIENLFRYAPCAVGLKPSALQGEVRLRITRTPTLTLSVIGYRLSPIAYQLSERPKRRSDPCDAIRDMCRRHETERQAERIVTPTIGIKMRARNERHPVLFRFGEQRGCA